MIKIFQAKKALAVLLLSFFAVICTLFFSSCAGSIDYFDYVSELRSNLFIVSSEDFSLRIYAVEKETPYENDGIKRDVSARTEAYFTAPSGNKNCSFYFTCNSKEYGGDASYDNVKGEFYYFCSLDVSNLKKIECKIIFDGEEYLLTAESVVKEDTMSARNALLTLIKSEKTVFDSLTDKYGFLGEIYLRLIYEDAPYYYVGIIDRDGCTTAYLLNAQSGKILAKRQY